VGICESVAQPIRCQCRHGAACRDGGATPAAV